MNYECCANCRGAFVLETERGGPFTADAINRLIKRIGERAGIPFPVHAHMLRQTYGRPAMGGWTAVGQNSGKLPRSPLRPDQLGFAARLRLSAERDNRK